MAWQNKAFKNMGSKLKLGSMIGVGMNTAFAVGDYKDARAEGSSRMGSLAKAGTTFAMGEVLGFGMIPLQMAASAPQAAVSAMEGIGKYQRQMNRDARRVPFINSNFNDYKQAYTMRQAGMQHAQQSQYNLQQTLMGNEASYLR